MNANHHFYRLDGISVVDISGADAATIVHNLTTNEVKSLEVNEGRETFVTDVRGKTLGHVCLFREDHRLRMIGPRDRSAAPAHSERLHAHIDKYTILEDAVSVIRDDEFVAIVLNPPAAEVLKLEIPSPTGVRLAHAQWQIGGFEVDAYQTHWLGTGAVALLVDPAVADHVCQELMDLGIAASDETTFHQARGRCGFPWYGIDVNESNLPQEVDRDTTAISFTKGCYLGQETVARLDAMGQVQKKLVRWKIHGAIPEPDTKLFCEEKVVGRLTSVAPDEQGAIAIGFARRSHFEAGAKATGRIESSETGPDGDFTAEIL